MYSISCGLGQNLPFHTHSTCLKETPLRCDHFVSDCAELHTRLDAGGNPAAGWRCTVCQFVQTDNADQVCDSCKDRQAIQFDLSPISKEESTDLAGWFKESGKVGEWQFTAEDRTRLGVNTTQVGFVLRYMRQNSTAVTKQQFEELLRECAQKKSIAAYDVL